MPEGMHAVSDHPCLTPGAQFHIAIVDRGISVVVDLPMSLELTSMSAEVDAP